MRTRMPRMPWIWLAAAAIGAGACQAAESDPPAEQEQAPEGDETPAEDRGGY
jgi:hypothetical protein